MRWKELLNLDLGALLMRRPPVPAPDGKPVYWWSWFRRRANSAASSVVGPRPSEVPQIPPGLQRKALDPTWRGPVYLNARGWRRDVILVAEHLRSLIACNAPLAPGLAAGALEDFRSRKSWTPQRATQLVRVSVAIVAVMAMAFNIAISDDGLEESSAKVQAVAMVIISLWLVKVAVTGRHARAGVFLALEHRIACGSGLSEAMRSLPRFFPRHLVDLVEAGETTGSLDPAFDEFNDTMLRALGTQRRLRAIFWYLSVVFGAQLLITSFLFVKVIPVFVELRQETIADVGMSAEAAQRINGVTPIIGGILPSLDTLIALFDIAVARAPYLAAVVLILLVWLGLRRFRLRRTWAARRYASVLTLIPWFRSLIVRHNLGQVALMLQGLLRAGVPLDRALALVLGSEVHPAYLRWLGALRERVSQGDGLKEAIRKTASRRLVPDSFTGLVEAGERSGQLPETLGHIAALYRRDTERRLAVLQAIVLPAGVLMLGYLVMATQVAVFRVLIDLSEFINV